MPLRIQRYEGSVSDFGFSLDRRGNKIKLIYRIQFSRVYGDEITLPDEEFICNRVVKYLAPMCEYWCGSAMCAYAKLLKPI